FEYFNLVLSRDGSRWSRVSWMPACNRAPAQTSRTAPGGGDTLARLLRAGPQWSRWSTLPALALGVVERVRRVLFGHGRASERLRLARPSSVSQICAGGSAWFIGVGPGWS